MTSYVDTSSPWSRLAAAEQITHWVVNRDWRRKLADIGFWLHYPNDYQLKESVEHALKVFIRFKLGAELYDQFKNETMFFQLAVYINCDKTRYEQVMTQLLLLGFSERHYPFE